jgi:fumarylacetoacetase
MIAANNPALRSWISVPEGSDFPIQNLPFGVVKSNGSVPHVATRVGDTVIDIAQLFDAGQLHVDGFNARDFQQEFLNPMMKKGKEATRRLRQALSDLFSLENQAASENEDVRNALIPLSEVEMCMPVQIGDYTDFYSSKEHATNVGIMFRDPANALLPNWLWIPVGYHGRSSSVIISGQDIHRPKGQIKPDDHEPPIFAASRQLDFELEMGFITYDGKPLGDSISTSEAEDYIFGMCLFNDWSARDIQKWEYVPLGPFLGKNFASSISSWIVTMDALQPFAVNSPEQDPAVLSYLAFEGKKSYDIHLQVGMTPENSTEKIICNSNFKYMYWNMSQQLAHHTVNGCNVRCGDLMGSGTISGSTPDSFGSMLELAWKGTKPLSMNDGSERRFIQDGDTVTMRGYCQNEQVRIGFGEVKAKILPTK